MEIIVKIQVGSHLYGTATVSSDVDIKGVYMPQVRDILLQKVHPVVSQSRTKMHGEKNVAGDIECELYNPQKYLMLLAQGQTIALEMLFAPQSAVFYENSIWRRIKDFAPHILTKRAASFIHYCQQQAHKYGAKGLRIAAARLALEVLAELEQEYGAQAPLHVAQERLKALAQKNDFLVLGSTLLANGQQAFYFEICGKRALLNASIKSARLIAQKIVDEYGQRARAAEQNEGIDWKALSHAVRIGYQALEFLEYHRMTFPRPEADHLRAIRAGTISFDEITQEIEQLLVNVEIAAQRSTLPETYDQQMIDDFIEQLYLEQIKKLQHK